MILPGYDAWLFRGPEEQPEIGTEPGDECGRWQEPDEDCPKAWRCSGTMTRECGEIYCNTCWEKAE